MIYDREAMQQAYLASINPHYEPSNPAARAAKAAMDIERRIAKRPSSPSQSSGDSVIGWIVLAIIFIAVCGGG